MERSRTGDVVKQDDDVVKEHKAVSVATTTPVDVIKQHVDGIQQAALTLPSSDDLAKVLFLTQQLLETVNEFMRLFAERQAVVAELNVDDDGV